MRSLISAAILLAASVASGGEDTSTAWEGTHCASISTRSPVGIEQTLLALATGAIRGTSGGGVGSGAGGVDIQKVLDAAKNANVVVSVDGVSRDVLVITRWRQMNDSIEALKADPGEETVKAAIGDVVEFLAAAQTAVEIGHKVKEFIADTGHVPGSFGYEYSFTYGRRSRVLRRTFVEDNHLRLTTCVCGGIPLMDSATLVIDAIEHDGATTIVSTLSVKTRFGRLPVVKRIIQRQLDKILRKVESRAQEIGRGGESTVIGAANAFVSIISPGGGP